MSLVLVPLTESTRVLQCPRSGGSKTERNQKIWAVPRAASRKKGQFFPVDKQKKRVRVDLSVAEWDILQELEMVLKEKTNTAVIRRLINDEARRQKIELIDSHEEAEQQARDPEALPTPIKLNAKRKILANNTSGYLGVYKVGNRWRAFVFDKNTGKRFTEHHADLNAAARAYDRLARSVYGPEAVLNFPNENPDKIQSSDYTGDPVTFAILQIQEIVDGMPSGSDQELANYKVDEKLRENGWPWPEWAAARRDRMVPFNLKKFDRSIPVVENPYGVWVASRNRK